MILNPRDPARIEDYADMLRSVLDGRTATYLSVPITTGRRFIEWFAREGHRLDAAGAAYREQHARHVIAANCDAARRVVARLRRERRGVVIEPTAFERPEWDQDQYRYFWGKVIERFVETVVLMDGWEYSSGCSYELLTALRSGAHSVAENGTPIGRAMALELIRHAIAEMKRLGVKRTEFLESIERELRTDADRAGETVSVAPLHAIASAASGATSAASTSNGRLHFKDAVLDELARVGNVAQFVSFGPGMQLPQRFSRVAGAAHNEKFLSPEIAVTRLLEQASDRAVNVRSFKPDQPKGEPLVYGLRSVSAVMAILREKATQGKYTIVNETIDIHDGGVSGVAMGALIEFSPHDTPKSVDKPGICALPREAGLHILQSVYGFRPALNYPEQIRVEFSVHPRRRGLRREHTLVWEIEDVGRNNVNVDIVWPNNFSRFVGDKVFGLLVADAFGLPVPRATVVGREVAPFSFGRQTGTLETWIRTSPEVRAPGLYATYCGWRDPYELIASEEERVKGMAHAVRIASVIAQEGVRPIYSGAISPDRNQPEGVQGAGDRFMVGEQTPVPLPPEVQDSVRELHARAVSLLGSVELEWVYDGEIAWIVQLHRTKHTSPAADFDTAGQIHRFDVGLGLDALRELLGRLDPESNGVVLVGDVGVSSHFGDILRASRVPWRIERN